MASQFTFDAIGTKWTIDISDAIPREKELEILIAIKTRIAVFDQHYSRFRADSLVIEMSKNAGMYTMPDDAAALLGLYYSLYRATGGLVTPLIGQVLVDAGYDASYSLTQKKPLEQPLAWEEVIEYSHPNLILKKPALLDFGAAGKGYLIDIVGDVIDQYEILNYCIDAGGDILQRNKKSESLKIGLENPEDFTQAIGIAEISNESLCASAGNRRAWGSYHHIIDPKKLASPMHILGVWVVAKTTLLADGIATALFFTSAEVLKKDYVFEYVILFHDHSVEISDGFRGEIFTA